MFILRYTHIYDSVIISDVLFLFLYKARPAQHDAMLSQAYASVFIILLIILIINNQKRTRRYYVEI